MENIAYSLGIALVVLAFIIGLVGTIAPIIPGLLLIWLGALGYAWLVVGFDVFSPSVFVLITLVALVAGTSNLWLAALGAKTTGASWRTLLVGFIGGIAGTFLIPIPILGTILGYASGLVLSEYVRQGQMRPALRTAFGGMVGWGVSTAVELAGGILMILLVATQGP
jgi:uncharacterized protein YqgC (DUF456 family)